MRRRGRWAVLGVCIGLVACADDGGGGTSSTSTSAPPATDDTAAPATTGGDERAAIEAIVAEAGATAGGIFGADDGGAVTTESCPILTIGRAQLFHDFLGGGTEQLTLVSATVYGPDAAAEGGIVCRFGDSAGPALAVWALVPTDDTGPSWRASRPGATFGVHEFVSHGFVQIGEEADGTAALWVAAGDWAVAVETRADLDADRFSTVLNHVRASLREPVVGGDDLPCFEALAVEDALAELLDGGLDAEPDELRARVTAVTLSASVLAQLAAGALLESARSVLDAGLAMNEVLSDGSAKPGELADLVGSLELDGLADAVSRCA